LTFISLDYPIFWANTGSFWNFDFDLAQKNPINGF
jgi:hypothetical protein